MRDICKKGFWVRLWMESGRSRSIIDEKYEFLMFEDGYTNDTRLLDDRAYNWAGFDMYGFESMRFKSGFEIIEKPPEEWLHKELKRLRDEQESIISQENLIKTELGIL